MPTGVSEMLKKEIDFTLFPNPSKGNVTISFNILEASSMEINLMDVQGKILTTLANGPFLSGKQLIDFDVKDMQSGIYLVEVKTPTGRFVHKMLVE